MTKVYTLSSLIADGCHHGLRSAVRLYHGKYYASRDVAVEAGLRLLRAALWDNLPYVTVGDEWYTLDGANYQRVYGGSGREFGFGDVTITESEHGVHARCGLLVRARGSWTDARYVPLADGLYKQEPATFRPPSPWAPVLQRRYAPFAAWPDYVPVIHEMDVYVNAIDVMADVPEYRAEVY